MPTHIQVGDIAPRIQYNGDGAQTRFDFPFPIFQVTDLEAYLDDTRQATGYTVYQPGESNGGYVIFDVAPAIGVQVTLRRWLAIQRTSDFQESGELRADVLNDELDYQTAALQQVADGVARALRLSPTDSAASLALPAASERAGNYLAFDGAGALVAAVPPEGGNVVSAFAATVLDDANAATARATLGVAIGSDVLAPSGDGSGLTNLPPAVGQCFLSIASGDLCLAPKGGNQTTDGAGNALTVSDTPVTLAATALTPGDWLYVYGSASAGTIDALEAVATVPVTASNGVQHKTGATGSVLLGWAQVQTGPAWAANFSYSLFNTTEPPAFIVTHEETAGTSGGTATASTWNTRPLNTIKRNTIFGCTLASNQMTLANAGNYKGHGWSVGKGAGYFHQLRLYNATDTATEFAGCSSINSSSSAHAGPMVLPETPFATTASKTFEFQHYVSTTAATTGLGQTTTKTGNTENEQYGYLHIRQEL